MIQEYVEFFTGEPIGVKEEEEEIIEEEINYDEMIKFFEETDGYVLVPISDPISEDLRILHRGIFPTSSYYEERDRRLAKKRKVKTYYDGKTKDQIVRETSFHKEPIKNKKKVTIIDRIKKIFAPFPTVKEENMKIVDVNRKVRKEIVLD